MKSWEKKLQDARYKLDGNGYVLDDKDAVEAVRLAYNQALYDAIQIVTEDPYDPGGLLSTVVIKIIKLEMKDGTTTAINHLEEGERGTADAGNQQDQT